MFITFGRVPLFYYVLHLAVIHAVTLALALVRYDDVGFVFYNPFEGRFPPGYGYPLWVVHVAWLAIVAALYLPCRWFATYKRTHPSWWISYL